MGRMKWLLVVLAGLAVVYGLLQVTGARRTSPQPLFAGFKGEAASKITLRSPESTAVLEKQGDAWIVTSEDSFPAGADAVEMMLEVIASFSRKDIISSDPARQALYQVDTTGIAVTVEATRGKTLAALVVGKMGSDYQSTYVRDAASNKVILAPGNLGRVFSRAGGTWQEKRLFAFEPADVVEMGIVKPGLEIVLTRGEDGSWAMSRPGGVECDTDKVNRLARSLALLTAADFAGRAPMPEAGVANPDSSVWARTLEGGEERLLIGHGTADGQFYATTGRGSVVYLLSPRVVKALLPDVASLAAAPEGAAPTPPPGGASSAPGGK